MESDLTRICKALDIIRAILDKRSKALLAHNNLDNLRESHVSTAMVEIGSIGLALRALRVIEKYAVKYVSEWSV